MGRKKKELKQLQTMPLEALTLRREVSVKFYGAKRIDEMAVSLANSGLRDPIVVKVLPGRDNPVIVMGGCRFLAAKKLAWKTLPVLLLDGEYSTEIKLLESLRDEALTAWDVSDHLHHLKNRLDWTQAQLGQAIGRTRDYVANMLSISQITPETRQFILEQQNGAELTARHLRYVARARQRQQMSLAKRMLLREVSTTVLERENQSAAPKSNEFRPSGLRALPEAGSPVYPRSPKDWKKYRRQLTTDIRRVNRRELLERKRTQAAISEARLRQGLVKQEARRLRRELQRELRRIQKKMDGGAS